MNQHDNECDCDECAIRRYRKNTITPEERKARKQLKEKLDHLKTNEPPNIEAISAYSFALGLLESVRFRYPTRRKQ